MRGSMVIKWLHRFITLALLIIVGCYLAYQYLMHAPNDDTLAIQKPISESITLYVTKYNGGGATVSDVYRYYLAPKDQTLKELQENEPFLVSDKGDAAISGYSDTVNVKLAGRVYSFNNSVLFYSNGVAVMPVINLNATGMRQ